MRTVSRPDPAESAGEISVDLAAVGKLDAVPTLLEVLCKSTGMGFAAVARVTSESWIACAVADHIGFGLQPGGELEVNTTLCIESRNAGAPITIDDARTDVRYRDHHTVKLYNIQSYISVPIVLASGRYFGNLCAIDPAPAKVSDERTLFMFNRFAKLIALQLDIEFARGEERAALLDERATSELREQFIAILGHDLRNPLQAVYAMSDLLEKRLTDAALIGLASRIKLAVRRMSGLIDDVLDFARSRLGGGIGIQLKRVDDIEGALKDVVEELQEVHPDRTILFEINVAVPVRCDAGRIQQLVSNLAGNALAHGSPQSPVKVSARATHEDLVLEVWNDGEPIPPESMDKIFAPFWRQGASATRQGLGLGLHICSQIVRAHGGELSVTSTREEGTAFKARLPLRGPA